MNKKMLDIKYFLIVIIVALLGYLIYINYFENKTVESFMQRNSLSSYYQSNDDDYAKQNLDTHLRHELRQTENNVVKTMSDWNGTWSFTDESNKKFYVTFLQVNTDLLFVINKMNYIIVGNNKVEKDPYIQNKEDNAQCLPDMIIGRGELNTMQNKFFMKHLYCSNNGDATGNFNVFGEDISDDTINNLYGYINDNGKIKLIQLADNGETIIGEAICSKEESFSYGPSAEYLLKTSYNIPTPNFRNSIRMNPDVCYNSSFNNYAKGDLSKCYIQNSGLPTPANTADYKSDDEKTYSHNIYGTGCADKSSIKQVDGYSACPIDIKQTCFIPIKNSDNTSQLNYVQDYKKCETVYDMNIKNQSSLTYPFAMKESESKNLLELCNHLEGFQNGKYNSAIVMYVDNLANVETLDFNFFGIKDGENYLTTKLDMMFPFMNNNILNKYRDDISDEKSLRLTNCIENNTGTNNFNTILTTCKGDYQDVKSKYNQMKSNIEKSKDNYQDTMLNKLYNTFGSIKDDIKFKDSNRLLQPTIWTLNFEKNMTNQESIPDYTNDCSFILGTSHMYNKEGRFGKYAEFDSANGKTKLNLHQGGNKQKLVLENPYIIDSLEMKSGNDSVNNDNNISNEYILMSGNLRTYNPKKYLVPGQGNKFNNFDKEIYLQNNVKPSGKWVILGFNLTEPLDRGTSNSLYTKTLLKTLKKITNTMNQ